jgi:hypothetical protein
MHRAILVGLVFLLVAASKVQAQQVPMQYSPERSPLPVLEMAPALPAAELTPVRVESRRVRHEGRETAAAAEPSARTLLAVVGAIVLAAALITLFT